MIELEEGVLTATTETEPFDAPDSPSADLVVDLEGYEGPLDVLLTLSREQKVDLRRISILRLAEQYLDFIAHARRLRLEIAADYLVMAAWLAYLKSRLLLPEPPSEDGEPSAEELAARLTRQLERLEAMRDVSGRLMARNRMGLDMFLRGAPEGIRVIRKSIYQLSLVELLKAYADHKVSHTKMEPLRMRRSFVWSVDDAYMRLSSLLGTLPDWTMLASYLPPDLKDAFAVRSAWASTLVASLEMSKQGRVQINQAAPFGPIFLKPIQRQEEDPA